MILLFDVGNTHTHVGIATHKKIVRQKNFPTAQWHSRGGIKNLSQFVGALPIEGTALCSVVPRVTPLIHRYTQREWGTRTVELTAQTVVGIGIDYPKPDSIGPDRLANAIAVADRFGAPSVVVDFGTAVTFDVIDRRGNYVGGIIAPGLSAMTDYLHEKTALLPRIKIREVRAVIGKNTEQAMLIGAVHGYRGLIRELLIEVKKKLGCQRLPVVATGGYARLMARKIPEIASVIPDLTLDGLRLLWLARSGFSPPRLVRHRT